MGKHEVSLDVLLKHYDEFCAIERRRIIEAHKKYGNDWRHKNCIGEAVMEMLDLFGYAALDYAQRNENKCSME